MNKTQSFLLAGGIGAAVLFACLIVFGILAVLLVPAIAATRARARQAQCASHLHQIGMAQSRCLSRQPNHRVDKDWPQQFGPYLEGTIDVFRCPADTTAKLGYGLNSRAPRMSAQDSQRIVALDYAVPVVEVVGPAGTDDWPSLVRPRHFGQANVLDFDGSVRGFSPLDIDPTVCAIHDRRWRPARDNHLVKPGCIYNGTP